MSSEKISKVKMFNEILESLLVQMSPIIGTTYYTKYQIIIKVNALLPIKQFHLYAMPYQDKILNKDESYFADDTIVTNLDVNIKYINKILKLQNIYVKLDKESRENVWQIFQCLLVLATEWSEL